MFFVGIDLAWSEKNLSGVAVFEGNRETAKLLRSKVLLSDSDILDFIRETVREKPTFIAIDAPLVVPNENGRRHADSQVCNLFGNHDAGAYPASRKLFLKWGDKIRGEEISKKLENMDFKQDPYHDKFETTRKFFEVYPHPAMVVIFELEKIIRYKKKSGRSYDFLWGEFQRYQNCLKKLENMVPSLRLPPEIVERNITGLRGLALKSFGDRLDAVFCAYIAYYAWACPKKCAVLGTLDEGYILSPIFPEMQSILQRNR